MITRRPTHGVMTKLAILKYIPDKINLGVKLMGQSILKVDRSK